MKKTETQPIMNVLNKNKGSWHNRVLLATPTTGNVRMEWVLARYGQLVPTNWSQVEMIQWMNNYVPLEYLLSDAENLVAKMVVEQDFEWLVMIEEDNIIPPDTFIRFNEYMTDKKIPIITGLYFTKSVPPEPVIYRGRGNGSFRDFKMGEKVWVDGMPFGCCMIHGSIIKALWEESPEYSINGQITRRVFNMPDRQWGSPDESGYGAVRGTTDLEFCTRIMENKIFEKAGWKEYEGKEFPLLCDTNIFVKHINPKGQQFPIGGVPKRYEKTDK